MYCCNSGPLVGFQKLEGLIVQIHIKGSPYFTRFHFTRFSLNMTFRKMTSLLVKFTLNTEKNTVK